MIAEPENGEVRRKYKYDVSGNMTQRIISEGGGVIDYFYFDGAEWNMRLCIKME